MTSVTLPTSATPGWQIEILTADCAEALNNHVCLLFYIAIEFVVVDHCYWLAGCMFSAVKLWTHCVLNYVSAQTAGGGLPGHIAELSKKMKKQPDGTSKKPPDAPRGYRWSSFFGWVQLHWYVHLNFRWASPLHIRTGSCGDKNGATSLHL